MKTLKRWLWWSDGSNEARTALVWSAVFVVGLPIFVVILRITDEPSRYALMVAASMVLFGSLSCELSQLAQAEVFRLAGDFERGLRRGVLQCVALSGCAGAMVSVCLLSWLPLITAIYTASVLACLRLPRFTEPRWKSGQAQHLQTTSESRISWSSMIALGAPVMLLHVFPVPLILSVLLLASAILLGVLPHFLSIRTARAASEAGGNVWRSPSSAMFFIVLVLGFFPLLLPSHSAYSKANPFPMLLMVVPYMGATSFGRALPDLMILRSRMWLAGMSRRDVCASCMWDLFAALASEILVYLALIGSIHLFGDFDTAGLIMACWAITIHAFMNWTRGMEGLLGSSEAAYFRNARWTVPVIVTFSAVFGLLWFPENLGIRALLALFALVILFVVVLRMARDYIHRFETLEF